jgi:HSP20 family protein
MTVKEIIKNSEPHNLPARREEEYSYPRVFRDMNDWMGRWDRLFDSFFNRAWGLTPVRAPEIWNGKPAEWTGFTPAINVSETDNELRVTAELPGLNQKDIEIMLDNNLLVIKGEKRQESEDKGRNFYRVERSYGKFQRSIALPEYVDAEKIEATFSNGVLTLTLPKLPELKPKSRKIEIQSAK